MTWHTATIPIARLAGQLALIRDCHGTVVSSVPDHDSVRLTWAVPTA